MNLFFFPGNDESDISSRDSRNPPKLSTNRRNTACSGNKDQIIICSVYRKTAAISSQIMILTILGGQTIFVASLLRLLFQSFLTQLEVEGGGRVREREREELEKPTRDRWKSGGERACVCSFRTWHCVFHVFMHVCVCVKRVWEPTAQSESVQTVMAADEARGPPDRPTSSERGRRQQQQKKSTYFSLPHSCL